MLPWRAIGWSKIEGFQSRHLKPFVTIFAPHGRRSRAATESVTQRGRQRHTSLSTGAEHALALQAMPSIVSIVWSTE